MVFVFSIWSVVVFCVFMVVGFVSILVIWWFGLLMYMWMSVMGSGEVNEVIEGFYIDYGGSSDLVMMCSNNMVLVSDLSCGVMVFFYLMLFYSFF